MRARRVTKQGVSADEGAIFLNILFKRWNELKVVGYQKTSDSFFLNF